MNPAILKYAPWAVVVIIFGFWLHAHDAAIKTSAIADTQAKFLSDLVAKDKEKDKVIAALTDSVQKVNVELDKKAKVILKKVEFNVDSLRATLDSGQKAQLDVIVAGFKTVIETKDAQIANLGRLMALKDTSLAEKNKLIDKLEGQVVTLTKALKPSKVETLTKIAAGALLVYGAVK